MTCGSRPVKRTQARLPVRIGQAAQVEDEVGVERDAVLVTEGLDQYRQRRLRAQADAAAHSVAQLVDARVAGVDDEFGAGDHRAEQFLLAGDGLAQAHPLRRQRVRPAAFRVALEQTVLVGVQEHDLAANALGAQTAGSVPAAHQDLPCAAARVHADGQVLVEAVTSGDEL